MCEGEVHDKIRNKIADMLRAKGYDPRESHIKKGDMPLYFNLRGKSRSETHFSDADIVVPRGDKIKYIIEIEDSDISPKKIVGDVVATYISNYYGGESEEIPISNAILFVVVNSEKVKKEGRKKEQFELIKRQLSNVLSGGSLKEFIICTEDDFEGEFEKVDSTSTS